MNSRQHLYFMIVLCCLLSLTQQTNYYHCISDAFNQTCKSQLYHCFNDSDCSYQLHENTKHILLRPQSQSIQKMYFSNGLAINLHKCLNSACQIGEMDSDYPKRLPRDYCLMQVWDICGGNVEEVYAGKGSKEILDCYRRQCPQLSVI